MGKFNIEVNILRKEHAGKVFCIIKVGYMHEDSKYSRSVYDMADIVSFKDKMKKVQGKSFN